jgi:hypothetical protein
VDSESARQHPFAAYLDLVWQEAPAGDGLEALAAEVLPGVLPEGSGGRMCSQQLL